ncbi:MAG: hypothetical protein FIA99_05160, partial [Ruminiclostridium sp.]|nr:hypothetical protein [Ruminiclostridium sp.]
MVRKYIRHLGIFGQNSRMFMQLFLYYFVIVTIILSLTIFLVYDRMKEKTYKEVGDLNIEMMDLLSRSMDELIMKKILEALSAKLNYSNTYFYDFITTGDKQDIQNIGWLMQDLNRIRLSNDFIESIYIY